MSWDRAGHGGDHSDKDSRDGVHPSNGLSGVWSGTVSLSLEMGWLCSGSSPPVPQPTGDLLALKREEDHE